MVQKGHLLLFVSKKRKECIRKMMQYIEEMHQNNDADHDESVGLVPLFSLKEVERNQ